MKVREMDVFFSVPIDQEVLTDCRKKCFPNKAQVEQALRAAGSPLSYKTVECCNRAKRAGTNRLRADAAEAIASVFGMPVEQVFPLYYQSKREAEEKADKLYYKPFATIEERNAAIVAAMDAVKWTALKYCRILKNEDVWYDQEEIIAIAFEMLVHMADRAMKKGIRRGVCFDAAACVAVKQDFLLKNKTAGQKSRKADLVSWEAYTEKYEGCFSSYDFVDGLILREEVLEAVQAMPDEKQKNRYIQGLLEELGLTAASLKEDKHDIPKSNSRMSFCRGAH